MNSCKAVLLFKGPTGGSKVITISYPPQRYFYQAKRRRLGVVIGIASPPTLDADRHVFELQTGFRSRDAMWNRPLSEYSQTPEPGFVYLEQ